jgi:hypothetical protein
VGEILEGRGVTSRVRVAGGIELARGLDADHTGSPQRAWDGFDLVPQSLERLDGGGLGIRLDQEAPQHRGRLAKRTQMMTGAEADSLDRFRRRKRSSPSAAPGNPKEILVG